MNLLAARKVVDRILLVAVGIVGLLLGLTTFVDTDLGWHLATGSWILENGRVPSQDVFSLLAEGREWIDLSWGFQVAIALVERLAGLTGLGVLKAALSVALVVVLWCVPRDVPAPVRAAVVLGALAAAWSRLVLRPEMASAILLALLVWRAMRGPLGWRWVLVFAAWANVHSLFAVGLGVWLFVLVGRGADALRGRSPGGARALRAELGWWGAAALATMLNPYGPRGSVFPFELFVRLSDPEIGPVPISELASPFSLSYVLPRVVVFAALAALAAISLALRRFPGVETAIAVALVPLGFLSMRNMMLATVGCVPTLAIGIAALVRQDRHRDLVRGLALVLAIGIGTAVVTGAWFVGNLDGRRLGIGLVPGFYPEVAAEKLARTGQRRFWTDMNVGGYLLWRVPDSRVSLDARLEVYGEDTFVRAWAIERNEEAWNRESERLRIDAVVMQRSWLSPELEAILTRDPRWTEVAGDPPTSFFPGRSRLGPCWSLGDVYRIGVSGTV